MRGAPRGRGQREGPGRPGLGRRRAGRQRGAGRPWRGRAGGRCPTAGRVPTCAAAVPGDHGLSGQRVQPGRALRLLAAGTHTRTGQRAVGKRPPPPSPRPATPSLPPAIPRSLDEEDAAALADPVTPAAGQRPQPLHAQLRRGRHGRAQLPAQPGRAEGSGEGGRGGSGAGTSERVPAGAADTLGRGRAPRAGEEHGGTPRPSRAGTLRPPRGRARLPAGSPPARGGAPSPPPRPLGRGRAASSGGGEGRERTARVARPLRGVGVVLWAMRLRLATVMARGMKSPSTAAARLKRAERTPGAKLRPSACPVAGS